MAEQTFNQTIQGYCREINKNGLPQKSGVYFVYECTFDKEVNKVTLHKLIYIGESDNINYRVVNHEKLREWLKYVNQGNELCYSYTFVDNYYRNRVEAAYVNRYKPPVNTEYINNFPFDKTIVKSSGVLRFIDDFFVVNTSK